jgi:hypothetical protein
MRDVFPVHDYRKDIDDATSSPPKRAEPHHDRPVRQVRRHLPSDDEPRVPGPRPGPRARHVDVADRLAGDR